MVITCWSVWSKVLYTNCDVRRKAPNYLIWLEHREWASADAGRDGNLARPNYQARAGTGNREKSITEQYRSYVQLTTLHRSGTQKRPQSAQPVSMYVCMYSYHIQQSIDQPGKVVNPARGQLNRENEHSPVPVRA